MRKAYIGGFASNPNTVRFVAESLSEHFDEDIEGISFREAIKDRLRLDKLARGALAITHSAGMMALRGSLPGEIVAVAPPVPTAPRLLVARAALKVIASYSSSASSERMERAKFANMNGGKELLTHGPTNLGQLRNISKFDAVQSGIDAAKYGINTTVGFMNDDAFRFTVSDAKMLHAESATRGAAGKLRIIRDIPGEHDELVFYPAETVEAVYGSSDEREAA